MTESPTKTIRPLEELHSPPNQDDNTAALPRSSSPDVGKISSPKVKAGSNNTTPSSSLAVESNAATSYCADDANNGNERNENYNYNSDGGSGGGGAGSHYLSPIGRMDLNTPAATHNNDHNNDHNTTTLDTSFPDNRDETIQIHSPNASTLMNGNDDDDNDESHAADDLIADLDIALYAEETHALQEEDEVVLQHDDEEDEDDDAADDDDNNDDVEDTEEDRVQRELEESEALARQLMEEEAMASYAQSTNYLRDNANQFSEEDMAALQAAMAEEDPESHVAEEDGEDNGDDDADEGGGEESNELSYDALLRLGERIGNVKEERWALGSQEQINKLPTLIWEPSLAVGKAENHTEVKCQVCQCDYEMGDELRRLPCNHCFHVECIDSWLQTKDTCALCRKSIVSSLP